MKILANIQEPATKIAWNEYECVQGCINNDRFQQEMFYRHFFPVMMGLVMRYSKDRDISLTILNNGFLKAYKNMDNFRNEGSLEGWLRRIMVNAVADYFKSVKSRFDTGYNEIMQDHNNVMPEIKYDYDRLLKILNTLPTATRTVVNMFFIDGFTHNQIAAMLNISEGTSKWHVSEGRKLLMKKLGGIK